MSSFDAAALEEAEAWAFVEWEMWWHHKRSDTWMQTMNRLIRKNEFLSNLSGHKIYRSALPRLTRETLEVSREKWSLEQLVAVRRDDVHLGTKMKCDTCPILIIDFGGSRFILDGNHRVNQRILDQQHGPHDVIVISHIPE
jgi:hypothetical protein